MWLLVGVLILAYRLSPARHRTGIMCVWLFSVGFKEIKGCCASTSVLLLSPLFIVASLIVVITLGGGVSLLKLFPCIGAREMAVWKHYKLVVRSGCAAYKEQPNQADVVASCKQCTAELYVIGFPVLLMLMLFGLPVFSLVECVVVLIGALLSSVSAACTSPVSPSAWWSRILVVLHQHDRETSLIAWGEPLEGLLLTWATSEAAIAAERAQADAERARQLEADRAMALEMQRRVESQEAVQNATARTVQSVTQLAANVAQVSTQARDVASTLQRWLSVGPGPPKGAGPVAPAAPARSTQASAGALPRVVARPVPIPTAVALPAQPAVPLPQAVPVAHVSTGHAPGNPWKAV